jgi:hypothetical protein
MMNNTIRRFVSAVDTHPFSMAIATVGTTTMTGVVFLKATDKNNAYVEQRRPLSTREAHFRAMVENAQESTWRENLQNVAMAQEQSMMVQGTAGKGDQRQLSKFVTKLNARGREILHQDQEYWRQKKEYEDQQKLFTTTTVW